MLDLDRVLDLEIDVTEQDADSKNSEPDNISMASLDTNDDQNVTTSDQDVTTSTNSLTQALTSMEAMFCLKMSAKHTISREILDDIIQFSEQVHSAKLGIMINQLKKDYSDTDYIKKVTNDLQLMDNVLGLKEKISTNYRREKYLKQRFNFLEPERIPIKSKEDDSETSFYYKISVKESLERLLNDPSLRKFLINEPAFDVIYTNQFHELCLSIFFN